MKCVHDVNIMTPSSQIYNHRFQFNFNLPSILWTHFSLSKSAEFNCAWSQDFSSLHHMGTLSFPISSSKSHLLPNRNRIAFSNPFPQQSFVSSAFRVHNFPNLHLRRLVLCAAAATGHSNHDGHHHHHHHHHGHHHCDHDVDLTGPQRAVIGFAKAIRWTDLANYLREHLQLCCCSMALLVAAAVCPYLVPKPAIVKPLQNAFIVIAFPLVGVWMSSTATLVFFVLLWIAWWMWFFEI